MSIRNMFLKRTVQANYADDVTYSYAYTVKGKKLILDFTEDIVRDCDYTFSVNETALTLIGGTGTDGGSYKLNKE